MSAWDKVFTGPAQAGEGQRFDMLQQKYQDLVAFAERQGMVLETLQLQKNRLLLRGLSPTRQALDRLLEEAKQRHPGADDLMIEIRVDASAVAPPSTAEVGGQKASPLSQTVHISQAGRTVAQSAAADHPWQYTVKPGDTLASLAARFYGDEGESRRILEANRERMAGPEVLVVGQVITIPPLKG